MKYKGRLRAEILSSIAPLEIRNYAALVNKYHVVKDCAKRLATKRSKACKRRHASKGT